MADSRWSQAAADPAPPECGHPEHIPALHQQDVVGLALAARPQLPGEPPRLREFVAREAGDRQRTEQGRRRLVPALLGQRQGSPLRLVHPLRLEALDQHQRGEQPGEQREFALATLGTLRECAQQIERAVEQAHRRVARVQLLRQRRRTAVPGDGLIGRPGAVVVVGQLPAHRAGVVGKNPLQRAGDAQVLLPPPHRTEGEVGDLADRVVAEVVGVAPLLAHEAALPEFVQAAHEGRLVRFARPRQHLRRELPPDRRGHPDQLTGRCRQLRQPRLDHRLHLRVQPRPPGLPRLPPRAQGLHHKERAPLRLAVELVRAHLPQRSPGQPLGERRRLPPRQPPERDLGAALQHPQPGEEVVQGVLRGQLLRRAVAATSRRASGATRSR
ncbi:MAG: hypothetical protein U0232_09425 [Thermomicrobiales bacterium]